MGLFSKAAKKGFVSFYLLLPNLLGVPAEIETPKFLGKTDVYFFFVVRLPKRHPTLPDQRVHVPGLRRINPHTSVQTTILEPSFRAWEQTC